MRRSASVRYVAICVAGLLSTAAMAAQAPARGPAPGLRAAAQALSALIPARPHLWPRQLQDRPALVAAAEASARAQHRLIVGGGTSLRTKGARRQVAAGSMPDVTGDGIDDILEIDFVPRRYVARDGRTGHKLWSIPATDYYALQYARLGNPARPALLTSVFAVAPGGGTTTGLVALDARTGSVLWQKVLPVGDVSDPVGVAYAGVFLTGGVLSKPAGSEDVLGAVAHEGFAAVASAGSSLTPLVLNGADGSVRSAGAPMVVPDWFPGMFPLPDLNGDGQPDYALAAAGSLLQVSVRDGAKGTPLWTSTSASGAFDVGLEPLANAAGDHRPGLVVTVVAGATSVTVHRGDTGATLWSAVADAATVVGQIDGDGTPDLQTAQFDGTKLTLEGLSGRTGRVLWKRTVTIGKSANVASAVCSPGGGCRAIPQPADANVIGFDVQLAGDLDGDGVADTLVRIERARPVHPLEVVVVRGRTGQARSGYRDLGLPLGAALRGHRATLVKVDLTPGRLAVTTSELTGPLWRRTVGVPGLLGITFVDYGRLGFSSGQDLLVSTFGEAHGDVLAMDGRTGAVRWRVSVA